MKTKLLIFLIDALGYDYLQEVSFLEEFGVEIIPLESLLGYSSTIMPAIWSGRYPEETGVWTEFYYSPRQPYKLMKTFGRIPNKHVRILVKRAFLRFAQRRGCWRKTLPGIPESVEHLFSRNLIQGSRFPPIELDHAFDDMLRERNTPYHYEFHKFEIDEGRILTDLDNLSGSRSVFIYYFGTIDALGHIEGPNPLKFKDKLEVLERVIVNAYSTLSRNHYVDLIVFSDHGMTEVRGQCDLLSKLRPYRMGKDYLLFLDSTLARFWFFNAKAREEIIAILNSMECGHVLGEEEIGRYKLRFKDNRYGEVIFVADPGIEFYPNFMKPVTFPLIDHETKGMHGYIPEEPSTRGIFMYHGSKKLELKDKMAVTDILDMLKRIIEGSH
jgi:predicted AlkP superfamily pyrophosphatase or phosphodiesterase